MGNRIQLTITPSGGTGEITDFSFDVLNRLETVTDTLNQVTSYTYDNAGNRESVAYPNGNITNYSYDSLNRLIQLDTVDSLSNVLTSYQYTLDASGHRTQIIEASGRTSSYRYDDLYRLTAEDITDTVNGNYSASYQYDAVGNRVASTINGVQTLYTVDDNDRLIQQGGESFTYDDYGNMLIKAIDADLTVYSYNAKNKLAQADITEQGINTVSSYQYDIDGVRTRKVVNGETIDFLTDSNRAYAQVVRETSTTTGNITDYLYGDDLIKQTKVTNDSYYLYDGLGSTRALTDATGSITDTYNYESFGSTLNQTGSTPNSYLFTGEQYDTGLDNYYLRARYYDQNVGRFTQMDTWMGNNSDPVTLHKYLYANANPVNMIDPSGQFSLFEFGVANTVRSILNELTVDVGISILDGAFSDGGESSGPNFVGAGIAVIGGPASFKLLRMLSSKFRKACNSFDADTEVWTEDGIKLITKLNIGDKVWALNEETGELELQDITHLIQREGDYELIEITINNETIDATANHPFYINTTDGWKWVDAAKLKVGDVVQDKEGNEQQITQIKTKPHNGKVFNLTVDNVHTYLVGKQGVVAHNVGTCKPLQWSQQRLNHLFRGDKNGGFHHRGGGINPTNSRVLKITQRGSGKLKGAYKASVEICDNGRCFIRPSNSFFPDTWSKSKVQNAINTAYNNRLVKNGGNANGTFVSKSSDGFPIQMTINNGEIVTAFPAF